MTNNKFLKVKVLLIKKIVLDSPKKQKYNKRLCLKYNFFYKSLNKIADPNEYNVNYFYFQYLNHWINNKQNFLKSLLQHVQCYFQFLIVVFCAKTLLIK